MAQRSPLSQAFAEDHRHMTRGFWKMRKNLEADDLPAAIELADNIDRLVGPHIEFEESVFYPVLRAVLGDEFVDQLYEEHKIGRMVLLEMEKLGEINKLTEAQRHLLVKRIKKALEHAVSCATLLSHLDTLDENRQQSMLDQLEQLRSKGHRWTELNETTPA